MQARTTMPEAMITAIQKGELKAFKLLLKDEEYQTCQDEDGNNPFLRAVAEAVKVKPSASEESKATEKPSAIAIVDWCLTDGAVPAELLKARNSDGESAALMVRGVCSTWVDRLIENRVIKEQSSDDTILSNAINSLKDYQSKEKTTALIVKIIDDCHYLNLSFLSFDQFIELLKLTVEKNTEPYQRAVEIWLQTNFLTKLSSLEQDKQVVDAIFAYSDKLDAIKFAINEAMDNIHTTSSSNHRIKVYKRILWHLLRLTNFGQEILDSPLEEDGYIYYVCMESMPDKMPALLESKIQPIDLHACGSIFLGLIFNCPLIIKEEKNNSENCLKALDLFLRNNKKHRLEEEDKHGYTALMHAASRRDLSFCLTRLLADQHIKATINHVSSKENRTALSYALASELWNNVIKLLIAGANFSNDDKAKYEIIAAWATVNDKGATKQARIEASAKIKRIIQGSKDVEIEFLNYLDKHCPDVMVPVDKWDLARASDPEKAANLYFEQYFEWGYDQKTNGKTNDRRDVFLKLQQLANDGCHSAKRYMAEIAYELVKVHSDEKTITLDQAIQYFKGLEGPKHIADLMLKHIELRKARITRKASEKPVSPKTVKDLEFMAEQKQDDIVLSDIQFEKLCQLAETEGEKYSNLISSWFSKKQDPAEIQKTWQIIFTSAGRNWNQYKPVFDRLAQLATRGGDLLHSARFYHLLLKKMPNHCDYKQTYVSRHLDLLFRLKRLPGGPDMSTLTRLADCLEKEDAEVILGEEKQFLQQLQSNQAPAFYCYATHFFFARAHQRGLALALLFILSNLEATEDLSREDMVNHVLWASNNLPDATHKLIAQWIDSLRLMCETQQLHIEIQYALPFAVAALDNWEMIAVLSSRTFKPDQLKVIRDGLQQGVNHAWSGRPLAWEANLDIAIGKGRNWFKEAEQASDKFEVKRLVALLAEAVIAKQKPSVTQNESELQPSVMISPSAPPASAVYPTLFGGAVLRQSSLPSQQEPQPCSLSPVRG